MIMTGEENFISAIEEDGRWSGGSETDGWQWQAVLGEEQCECGQEGRYNTQPMQYAINNRLAVLIFNDAMEAL